MQISSQGLNTADVRPRLVTTPSYGYEQASIPISGWSLLCAGVSDIWDDGVCVLPPSAEEILCGTDIRIVLD